MASTLHRRFGVVLREYRGRTGLSQEKLADLAGLDRSYVSQIERGLKSPSLTSIEALAQALGTRAHVLVRAAERLSG